LAGFKVQTEAFETQISRPLTISSSAFLWNFALF